MLFNFSGSCVTGVSNTGWIWSVDLRWKVPFDNLNENQKVKINRLTVQPSKSALKQTEKASRHFMALEKIYEKVFSSFFVESWISDEPFVDVFAAYGRLGISS